MVLMARRHIDRAAIQKSKTLTDENFLTRLAETEARVAAVEVLAKSSEEAKIAVEKGLQALIAGELENAATYSSTARKLFELGLKSTALQEAVEELEARLASAAAMEADWHAGCNCLAAAQSALLQNDFEATRVYYKAADDHFSRARATEMRAVLDNLAIQTEVAEEQLKNDEARWHGLLAKAGILIKQGNLVGARAAIEHARDVREAAGGDSVGTALETIEQRLLDEEEREKRRRDGDMALQEAIESVGRGELNVARGAVGRARAAYEQAGAAAMQEAVEKIQAVIAEAELEVELLENNTAKEVQSKANTDVGTTLPTSPWRMARDPRTGYSYYYHTESSWIRPNDYDPDTDAQLSARAIALRSPVSSVRALSPVLLQSTSHLSSQVSTESINALRMRREAECDSGRPTNTGNATPDHKPPTPDPPVIEQGKGGFSTAVDVRATVEAYAAHLGIDSREEPGLLWIAEEGLRAQLPAGYSELADADGTPFFVCNATRESSWEHPLDDHYRRLAQIHRAAAAARQH